MFWADRAQNTGRKRGTILWSLHQWCLAQVSLSFDSVSRCQTFYLKMPTILLSLSLQLLYSTSPKFKKCQYYFLGIWVYVWMYIMYIYACVIYKYTDVYVFIYIHTYIHIYNCIYCSFLLHEKTTNFHDIVQPCAAKGLINYPVPCFV